MPATRMDVVVLPTKKVIGMDREAGPMKLVEYGTHRKRDKMQIGTSDQADLPLKERWWRMEI